ncbi:NAD(P)-linked oxidoreductase [Glarea lozoyensis ATCC 20868]|uniref:NAD(P)-linked oxidoreductase n=1 Tax=Glarea lozoyensis (strain ATCC 20868 / MF5171) TaxID=1116229 RepID=S3DQJ4_GLAL2|nr:NAD(P)-linked oxidoreductase [Glarea lozoyensis ATCC 20868]EPE34276.1 NAD(P)-linked oxidoreductase [Glarea lozoyensis ATCC 20868]
MATGERGSIAIARICMEKRDQYLGHNVYSNGRSEEIIGEAIKHYNIPREDLVIMTKIFYALDPIKQPPISALMDKTTAALVNRVGLSRKHILDAVDASIARLGTYIDVLQIHRLDRDCSQVEIMHALNDVVASGKVRYLGASSMQAWEFQKLQNIADKHNWHKFISMQNYWNLLHREEEREMVPYCRDANIGIIPWSPLARGALARPFDVREGLRNQNDKVLSDLVRGQGSEAVDEMIIRRLEEVAKKCGVSMAVVALAWSLSKQAWPVTGLNSIERINEAISSVTFVLSSEDVAYLEEPYRPKDVSY